MDWVAGPVLSQLLSVSISEPEMFWFCDEGVIGLIDLAVMNSLRSEDDELSELVELLELKKEPPVELATLTLLKSVQPALKSNMVGTFFLLACSRTWSVLFTLLLWCVMERVIGRLKTDVFCVCCCCC